MVTKIFDGIAYTAQPDNGSCTGCAAAHDDDLCVRFMLTQPGCGEHPIIWVIATKD